MYKYLYFAIFTLFGLSQAGAKTVEFDRTDLIIDENHMDFQYSDFDNLAISDEISVPCKTVYINSTNVDFSYSADTQQLPGKVNNDLLKETVTSSQPELYLDIVSAASFDRLGHTPVMHYGQITIGGDTYQRILLFPVTIDSSGLLFFNHSISVMLNSYEIQEAELITTSTIRELRSAVKENSMSLIGSQPSRYLIVTNSYLQSAFHRLVDYKNETGITTDLVLIEDILPTQTGRDDAEKLREYLKQFYAEGGEFVLLGGDETILPIRYTYHNVAYSDISLENQQLCDLYFADVDGNWNADNDNIWGEKYTDSADLSPELKVGRLPFNSPDEVGHYIDKLIGYETNSYQIDLSYLEKVFFFSSDQMRDYDDIGQHALIAGAYPGNFMIDTINGVELSHGDDLSPTNLSSKDLEPVMSEGYGIVNIIAHGSSTTFAVRTSGYNNWPKSYFTTDTDFVADGTFANFDKNNRVSFYASLGCDNGAFDKDQPPFNHENPNVVQVLLGLANSGAVGFIANTRWGWVSSSHLLQKQFFEHLFANPNRPAIEAMHDMKDDYYFYRDLVYGINFFGDPTLVVYTQKPNGIQISLNHDNSSLTVHTGSNGSGLDKVSLYVSKDGDVVGEYISDHNGVANVNYDFDYGSLYKLTAVKDGFTIAQKDYVPSIVTGIEDELNIELPDKFSLEQNYPNPFNPATTIRFSLPTASAVTLKIFNILGQEITTLTDGFHPAGQHEVTWDSRNNKGAETTSGIYIYKIETADFVDIKKMILLR